MLRTPSVRRLLPLLCTVVLPPNEPEGVEIKQPMQPVGESEVFWHLALRTDLLEKSLEAAINAGCEVTVPIRPLDLLNDVTQKPLAGARCFPSRAGRRINRTARR